MTRKHFTAIANALFHRFNSAVDESASREIEQIAVDLANEFEKFNAGFNRSKFLAVALGATRSRIRLRFLRTIRNTFAEPR